ncbi:MAG: hypothetical protein FJ146_12865 [Deltaproteobacteria bacterium]|nr:hypothetical protein [Deltaproteobacteria bacterium]
MTDGLKKILTRVAETPTSTMIDRYLALVSELSNEQQKTERVLDLGEALIAKAPTEALRVVGMVHDAAPKNVRAYAILIAAFEKLGRTAKAGVLRLERDKLLKAAPPVEPAQVALELSSETYPLEVTPEPSLLAPPPEGTGSMADLALSLAGLSEAASDSTMTLSIPSSAKDSDARGSFIAIEQPPNLGAEANKNTVSTALGLNKIQSMVDGLLKDRSPSRVGSALKSANSLRNPLAATKSDDAPTPPTTKTGSTRISQALRRRSGLKTPDHVAGDEPLLSSERTSLAVPPLDLELIGQGEAGAPDGVISAASESLDPERLDLLTREAQAAFGKGIGLEAQAASDAFTEGGDDGETPSLRDDSSALSATNLRDLTDISEFWDPLHARMAKVDWDQVLGAMHEQRESHLGNLEQATRFQFSLPAAAIQALSAQFQSQVVTDPAKALIAIWETIQGIWGEKPDSVTVALLQDLNLTHATRGFWGLYLDALLARGSGRRVLFEVASVVARERQLSWAKTGWQRLPTAWRQLGLRGFAWQEDEGVDALLVRLRQRPRQTMRSLLVSA